MVPSSVDPFKGIDVSRTYFAARERQHSSLDGKSVLPTERRERPENSKVSETGEKQKRMVHAVHGRGSRSPWSHAKEGLQTRSTTVCIASDDRDLCTETAASTIELGQYKRLTGCLAK